MPACAGMTAYLHSCRTSEGWCPVPFAQINSKSLDASLRWHDGISTFLSHQRRLVPSAFCRINPKSLDASLRWHDGKFTFSSHQRRLVPSAFCIINRKSLDASLRWHDGKFTFSSHQRRLVPSAFVESSQSRWMPACAGMTAYLHSCRTSEGWCPVSFAQNNPKSLDASLRWHDVKEY